MAFSSSDPRNYLAVGRQADADTAATAFKFVKYLGDSGFNVELDSESIYEGGDGQDHGHHYRARTRADGQITANVRPDTFTYLSAWAMGSGAAIGTSAGVGTSIFVPNATIPALTVEQAWGGGNQIERTHNAILTGWQLEGEAGGLWRLTTPFISGGTPVWRDGVASALTPVLESGDPVSYAGGAYLAIPSSNGNNGTTIDIRRFAVNFERQVDDGLYTTETFRRKVVPLTRSLEVTFQLIFQDANLYRNIVYGGAGASVVPQSLATGAFHAERILTGSQMCAVDVPNLRYTGVGVNRLEPDGQTVVMDVSAMGVKAGTGIIQVRSTHSGIGASAYLSA